MTTERIANFSLAFNQAFELLRSYREEKRGADCNQAIMLITDGVPENYKDTFKYYNWYSSPDNPDEADMPVRIFTYLIGKEVADYREVKWMACANRGFFVHLSTLAEVREQVRKIAFYQILNIRNFLLGTETLDVLRMSYVFLS